jgi:small subunit ribosomal protein S17
MTNNRRRLVGVVTAANSAKTVKVQVDRTYRHPLYQKVLRTSKTYMVHDELGCQVGDEVKIVETRPISKRKRWAVEEILREIEQAEAIAQQLEIVDESAEEAGG